ncbi:hypothetical protein SVIO_043180 [Streptomyces violaceusniger]|uniref:YycE-like N-terminal domain-containing protein n=1 Tax=Streptomyces violaceusniger TaxID=68280 RepID=A0A4D4KXM6_STRVO|nr:hypothetical protein SVIO_043180 [Streptomyces violaceusniger]
MPADGQSHIRIARPSRDLAAAERFWCTGLGLSVVYRVEAGEHDLLMVGWPDASWHLELVYEAAHPVEPRPTEEDLLVIYLDEPVPRSWWTASPSTAAPASPPPIRTGTNGASPSRTRTATAWCCAAAPGRIPEPTAGGYPTDLDACGGLLPSPPSPELGLRPRPRTRTPGSRGEASAAWSAGRPRRRGAAPG